MKKTNFLLMAFAIFAATLILMTGAIASPIQESKNIQVLHIEKIIQNELIGDSDFQTTGFIFLLLFQLVQWLSWLIVLAPFIFQWWLGNLFIPN